MTPVRSIVRSTFVALVLAGALIARSATARAGWPRPAAGESASGDPELIITFDDGPHERWTPEILDTLREHHVQAVFFWVGRRVRGDSPNAERRRALVDRAVVEGHIVANHTVMHPHLCGDGLSTEQMKAEITDAEAMLTALAAMPVRWFRTPFGAKCRRLVEVLDELGLHHLHWDIDPQEWKGGGTKRVVAHVTRRLARLEGRAVLILHDTKGVSVRALPLILDWIDEYNAARAARGQRPIRIVSASELAAEQLAPGLEQWLGERRVNARVVVERLAQLVPVPPAEISRF